MSKFNLRLRELRKQKKLTQQELADDLGISKSSVNMYERGEREPGLDLLEAIADFFNVNLDYLMGKSNDPINYDDDILIANIPEEIVRHFDGDIKKAYKAWQARTNHQVNEEILDIQNYLDRDISEKYGNDLEKALTEQRKRDEVAAARDAHILVNTKDADENPLKSNISYVLDSKLIYQIPVYESVSAGFGAYADNDIIDYIPVVIKNPRDVGDTIAIKVTGDSMYPKIENGDLVVVRRQNSVDSGDIAVVLLDGDEGLVKKVVYDDGWIELQSINPEYKPKRYENAEVTRLRVVGKVMQIIKTL